MIELFTLHLFACVLCILVHFVDDIFAAQSCSLVKISILLRYNPCLFVCSSVARVRSFGMLVDIVLETFSFGYNGYTGIIEYVFCLNLYLIWTEIVLKISYIV